VHLEAQPLTDAAFRYSLPVLKIFSICDMYYRFSVPAVNIGMQPERSVNSCI